MPLLGSCGIGLALSRSNPVIAQSAAPAGADLRSRSVLAEAAAEPLGDRLDDRPLGGRAGQRLDDPSPEHGRGQLQGGRHHGRRRQGQRRRGAAGRAPAAAAADPTPIGECCKVAPPVLVYDQAGNLVKSWGGPGQGLRLAGQQSRHHGRSRRATSGSPATAHKDTQILKFDERRQVPASDRQARRAQRQQRHRELLAADEDLGRRRRPTRSTSPTATATAASSCFDADTGKYKRHWGAYGNKPSDEQDARRTTRRARRRSSSTRCTARSSRTTASSTSATASTIASRCSARTARS